jgi:hypothetical protein
MKGMFRALGLVCAAALVAACGGSGSETESTGVIGGSGDEAVAEIEETGNNCVDAASAFTAIVQGVTLNLINPSEFDIEAHRENVRRALEIVPDEVSEEFKVFADAYLKVGEILDEIGKTGGLTTAANIERLNELSEELERPEVQEKVERLAEYFQNECIGG